MARIETAQNESRAANVLLENVTKTYVARDEAVEALHPVNLEIRPGEFVCFLGPSGCGKSTLMMMVAGLLLPSSGRISVGGRTVTKPLTDAGIVFQESLLLEWRHALGNVLLQVEARAMRKSEYKDAAMRLLDRVGLAGFETKYPRELSGGMKMRVAICRALIHDPPLLLMDEPFGPLDALTREQLMIDLHHIWHERRKTALFVTHSIPEAVFLSDRVVVMTPRPGRIERIIEIDFPHPRRLDIQASPRFAEYTIEIMEIFKRWGVLREE